MSDLYGKGTKKLVEKGKYRLSLSGGKDPRTGKVFNSSDGVPDTAFAVEMVGGPDDNMYKRVKPTLLYQDATEEQRARYSCWQTPVKYLRAQETFLGSSRQADLRIEEMRRELKLMRDLLLAGADPDEFANYGIDIINAAHNGARAHDLISQLEDIKRGLSTEATFDKWCERYLSTREKMGELRKSTLKKDRSHSVHLLRYLSGTRLRDIEPSTVHEMYADMRDNGMGDETLLSCHSLMKRVMQDAYDNDRVDRNVMDKVKKPERTKEVKRGKLEPDEARRLLEIISSDELKPYTMAVFLGLALGARLGEVLGLQWKHVVLDGERPHILICQQHTRFNERTPLKTSKIGKEQERVVPLDSSTIAFLKAWKTVQLNQLNVLGIEQSGNTPLIANEAGCWVTHSNLERWFRSFCVRNGFGIWRSDDGREIVELEIDDPLAQLYDPKEYLLLWHDSDGWACDETGRRYSRSYKRPKVVKHYDGLRFHWFRHTHFSMRLASGMDIPTCQALGGWNDPRILMTVYAHPLDEKVWSSAGFMDKLASREYQHA